MTLTKCGYCNFMYDEWYGDTRNGVPAGTPIADLAGTLCSRCGIQGNRHERQPGPKYAGQEAEYYDQFAGKAGIGFYKNWLETAMDSTNVLELGVGTGRLAVELAEIAASYCGVDWSPRMLKIADAKRRRLFKEKADDRLQLVEADILSFQADRLYSRVLCPNGILQHFTDMGDQIVLLRNIGNWLTEGGQLAVDLLLPPGEPRWERLQRKRLKSDKWIAQRIEGETSLSRQLFRCSIAYETYVEGMMESRYNIEREYALMTPKEMVLLLASEGYQVTRIIENYGLSTPWQTAIPTQPGDRKPAESLEDTITEGNNAASYRHGAWMDGGYPFGDMMPVHAFTPVTMTLIAQKKT